MEESADSEALETPAKSWGDAVQRKDFHAAVGEGMAAYASFSAKNNEKYSDAALGLVYVAIDHLQKEKERGETPGANPVLSCSFCGKGEHEVRLGAGPNVLICAECVELFHDIFTTAPSR